MWFFEIPCLSNKSLIFFRNLFFQPYDCSHMSTSTLDSSFRAGFCVVEISTCPCRSKPIMHLVLRSSIKNVASFTSQPADRRFVFNNPRTQFSCLLYSTFWVAILNFSAGMNCAIFELSMTFFVIAQLRKDAGLPVSTVNWNIWSSIRTMASSDFILLDVGSLSRSIFWKLKFCPHSCWFLSLILFPHILRFLHPR